MPLDLRLTAAFLLIAGVSLQGQPVSFEENRGQRDARIRYTSQAGDVAFAFEPDGVTLRIGKPERAETIRLQIGKPAKVEGEQRLPRSTRYMVTGTSNYQVSAPHYAAVRYHGIADHVDGLFISGNGAIPIRFIVQPGGNIADVRMQFKGASSVSLDRDGNLHIHGKTSELIHAAPQVYQTLHDMRIALPARYAVTGNTVTLEVKNYERGKELLIESRILLGGQQPGAKQIATALEQPKP